MRARRTPSTALVCVVVTGLVALAPMSTDIAIPALPAIGRALDATPGQVGMMISLFALGVGVMQLVYGPLSDRFGRRRVLMAALVIYVLTTVGIVVAPNIESLVVLRFLQAIGACAGTVLGRAIVRDMFDRDRAGQVLGYVMTAMTVLPGLGPIVGGELLVALGWRAVFGLILAIGLVIALSTWRYLPETLDKADRQPVDPCQILRHFGVMLRHRGYLGFTCAICGAFVALFGYIAGASYVYIDALGVAENRVGWLILTAVIGYIAGGMSASRFQSALGGLERVVLYGLILMVLAGAAMAGLLLAGHHSVWAVALPASVVFAGCGAALPQATAGVLGPFPHVAGTASSLMGALQMVMGAITAALISHAYDGSHGPMIGAMAGGPLVGLLLYVWLVRPLRR